MHISTILALTLVASAAFATGQPCELSSIDACSTTNQLVWSTSFQPALGRFLGHRKVGWIGKTMDLTEVVGEVLGGPPDDVAKVTGQLLRFSAVRFQSAEERGSVFITDGGEIKAVGVLHFNCARGCDKSYTLSIILTRQDEELAGLVRAWGEQQMRLNAQSGFEQARATIGRVEVLTSGD